MTARQGLVRSWLWALPFWMLPLVDAVMLAYAIVPPEWGSVVRSAVALSIVSLAALFLCRAVCPTRERLLAAHGLVGIGFALFPSTLGAHTPGAPTDIQGLIQYGVLTACAIFFIGAGPARVSALLAPILKVMSVLLIAATAVKVWNAHLYTRLQPAVSDAISQVSVSPRMTRDPESRPDIYQLLLDGFGNPQRLLETAGINVGPLADELKRREFQVIEDGMANYDQTYLSLASMLNMTYLDVLAKASGDTPSRLALHRLIGSGSVFRSLRGLGYRVEVFSADYSATREIESDRCHCPPVYFGEFEAAVLALTPLAGVGLGGLEYRPHREYVLRTFDELEAFSPPKQPVFVFAHVLAPHLPIVFDEFGHPTDGQWRFSFADGAGFEGTHSMLIRGYEGQARYIAKRLLRVVDRLIAASQQRQREAIIIVHGDHAVRFSSGSGDATAADGREMLPILLAIRWAPATKEPVPVKSLVNVYREVFRRYFSAPVTHLPDKGHVTNYLTPFRFIPATAYGE